MSLVYITHHNENILDLDQTDIVEQIRPQTFTSKYRLLAKKRVHQSNVAEAVDGRILLTDSGKYGHRTMGYAQTPLNPPSQFLRKQQGVKWRRLRDHVCPKGPGMPPVPRRPPSKIMPSNEPKKEPSKTKRESSRRQTPHTAALQQRRAKPARANFVELNIERARESKVKLPPPRYVDTPNGDSHNVLNTGLVPQHVCGKNFGKVPIYLRSRKRMLQKLRNECPTQQEQDSIDQCAEYTTVHGVRQMTGDERLAILEGLRTNFIEQSKVFQRLSLYTDTLAKKLRKSRIEKDLRQLEQDIYLIENNSVIYVSTY